MDIIGHVRQGVIVLDKSSSLPDGTRVRIQPMLEGSAHPIDPEVAQFAGLLPPNIDIDDTRLAAILEKHT